ncbi:hypothetical protein BH10PSE7_BH10PSE7_40540 [soil metagenome]
MDFDRPPKISRRFLLAVSAAFIIPGLGVAPALAATPAEQYVSNVGNDVIKLANSGAAKAAMRSRFSGLIGRNANVRAVGLLALGPFQKQLPPGLRDQFFQLVTTYIASFFVYYIDEFQGTGLQINSSAKQGNSTIVDSAIVFKNGGNKKVRWRINGGRVNDVNVRGVWLSLQLKERFTKILKRTKGDFGPLFEELKSAETW